MRQTTFDLDGDSTIVSVLAVREPQRAAWSALHALALTLLTAACAGVVILALRGHAPWQ